MPSFFGPLGGSSLVAPEDDEEAKHESEAGPNPYVGLAST